QGLDPRVEAVEPHAELRTPHVDVTAAGDGSSVVARGRLRILELAFLERLVHVVELATREDPIHETREPWRTVEVLGVRRQHDLAAALPAFEAEGTGAHRLDAKSHGVPLGDIARDDLRLAHGKQAHERRSRFGERYLHGVAVERRGA